MYRVLLTPLVLSGLLVCCARGAGEVTTTPDPTTANGTAQDTLKKPARLVRRLAEAADGYRDGRDHWVVASRKPYKGNHRVVGVFDSSQEAKFVAAREGLDYDAFGPFKTPKEEFLVPPGERVKEVIVVYVNGMKTNYSADSVDAVFWGLSAFDKFIVPYLASVATAEYAAEQREAYRRDESELAGSEQVAHKKGSF